MIAAAVLSFVVALSVQPAVMKGLTRRSMWDAPNARSSHVLPTPRGGGIAVVLAVIASLAWTTFPGSTSIGVALWILVACWVAAAAVGLIDDVRSISARARLAAQLLIAIASVVVISTAAGDGSPVPQWLFVPVAVLGVVAYINAFNFMDGINGISGLHAAVGCGYYAWLAVELDLTEVALVAAAVCGAAVGFLPWNLPRARIFLGDVGSYFLGACLGSLAVLLWLSGAEPAMVVAPLSIYLADTGATLFRRARAGDRLLEAHREHAYQRLSDVIGHTGATLAATAATSTCVLIAVAGRHLGSGFTFLGITAVATIYLVGAHVVRRRVTQR